MVFGAIEGQERAVEILSKALATKSVPHAWLFHGPEGVGKELAAAALARALICPASPWEGCGECPSCVRVAHHNHPDVLWVMPEDDMVRRGLLGRSDLSRAPSREIRIEQIRQLQERLRLRSLEGPHKVIIIVPAHAMNVAAQNALLRTLEEPPSGSHFILVSSGPDRLLATIRSRCSKVSFGPISTDRITAWLQKNEKLTDDQARHVAAMADGSLSRAAAMNPRSLEKRGAIIDEFEALDPSDARTWLSFAESLGDDRATAEAALDVLQVWLRDVAVAQVGRTELVNADKLDAALAAGAKVSPIQLHRRVRLLDEARQAIVHRNGAARLQLERMFIEMFGGGARRA
jgi:DNA polymerase-3 subunit delta'